MKKTIIIESNEEYTRFKDLLSNETFIIFPLFSEDNHPIKSVPVLIVAKCLKTQEIFVLSHSHSECLPFFANFDDFMTQNGQNCFILDKKYMDLQNSMDLESFLYSENQNIALNTRRIKQEWVITPVYKIVDSVDEDFCKVEQNCLNFAKTAAFDFINTITIPILTRLEKNGLKVDRNLFPKPELVDNEGYVYTQYNHLTTTGRPSNRYAGVNYSALNKSDKSRKAFVSRFGKDGELVLLDYDSYHPRLIANIIDYELPSGSVHEYFGKEYFKTDKLTNAQYGMSKQITFKLIYGNITDEYKGIEFFNRIDKMIDLMWDQYNEIGYVRSIISGIKLTADSKTKLFNYFIQNYETEKNMVMLQEIFKKSAPYESVPILYTYDSILFDVHLGEWEYYISMVKNIMESNDKFPVKMYSGKNYSDMEKFDDLQFSY